MPTLAEEAGRRVRLPGFEGRLALCEWRARGPPCVSPIEYSSGRRTSRRLNHGGDRQANAALHRIVFTRLRHDPRTQAYDERHTQEGKTRREIIRCLERYAAREVFNLVRTVSTNPLL
ncbi:transposase [Streptomyces sp. NPDC014995]|uniref:transposase n=1 Tax=Streptomyces sp. NPDC014995 TaxID=3364936 RepID=UPI0036FD73C8